MTELSQIKKTDFKTLFNKKTKWGRWSLKDNTLVFSSRPYYDITLNRCATAVEVLDWLFHMCEKNWMTDADLGNLVRAMRDTVGWGSSNCK